MPLYRLHIHNGFGITEDHEGAELPGLDAARVRARDSIRSIVSDEARQGLIDLTGRIDIVDDAGKTLTTMPFRDAFDLKN